MDTDRAGKPHSSRLSSHLISSHASVLSDAQQVCEALDAQRTPHARVAPACTSDGTHVSCCFSPHHLVLCGNNVRVEVVIMDSCKKRPGNRLLVGGGECRCCGSFLDPQLEHAETCSTAEATRGHYASVHAVVCGMKLADPGIYYGTQRTHRFVIQVG